MTSIEDRAWDALYEVNDPEIGVNVVDLGLVYELSHEEEEGAFKLTMTLTSPGCPLQEELEFSVKEALRKVSQDEVELNWTLSPLWSPAFMSDDGRQQFQALGGMLPVYP